MGTALAARPGHRNTSTGFRAYSLTFLAIPHITLGRNMRITTTTIA